MHLKANFFLEHETHNKDDNMTIDQLKLQMDRLWNDHYWYTRQIVRDAASNDKCLTVDLNDLYENQDDLGKNFATR